MRERATLEHRALYNDPAFRRFIKTRLRNDAAEMATTPQIEPQTGERLYSKARAALDADDVAAMHEAHKDIRRLLNLAQRGSIR